MLSLLFNFATATALLEFDPPGLTLQDTVLGASFRTRMINKPTSNAKIYFEAPGLTFSDCFVDITVDTFDQWRNISISGVSVFEQRNVANFNITARAFVDETFVDHGLGCSREVAPAGTCLSIGDPHFQTLNGLSYSQFGTGPYHLAVHEHLAIQTIQGFCFGNTVTCNQAIAIRYGSSIIALDTRGAGKAFNMTEISKNVDGIVYQNPTSANAAHIVTLPCGSVIQLLVNNDNNGNKWIDHTLHLAAGYDSIGGLCNRPPGKLQGLILRTGVSVDVSAFNQFADSWKVADGENLFMGNYKPSVPAIVGVHSICTLPQVIVEVIIEKPIIILPPYVPPVILATTAPVVTSTLVLATTMATPVPTTTVAPTATTSGSITVAATTTSTSNLAKGFTTTAATTHSSKPTFSPPANYVDEITAHCTKIFNVPGCSELVNAANYINACIQDAKTCGSLVFAEPARLVFMSHCKQTSNYMAKDYDVNSVQQAKNLQEQHGFNDHNCPANCNGNGVCGDNGCRCKSTFGGSDCSIDLTKKLCIQNNQVLNYTPANRFVVLPALPKQVTPPSNYVQVFGQDASVVYAQSAPKYPTVQPSQVADLPKSNAPSTFNSQATLSNYPSASSNQAATPNYAPSSNSSQSNDSAVANTNYAPPAQTNDIAAAYGQVASPAITAGPILSSSVQTTVSIVSVFAMFLQL
ncbi:hypothetical protein HDV01_004503 [Terramyces sp. JEL0728]|nr:hypothetical protein HDV01_004503 [Terramyces sp. JEL0728]